MLEKSGYQQLNFDVEKDPSNLHSLLYYQTTTLTLKIIMSTVQTLNTNLIILMQKCRPQKHQSLLLHYRRRQFGKEDFRTLAGVYKEEKTKRKGGTRMDK